MPYLRQRPGRCGMTNIEIMISTVRTAEAFRSPTASPRCEIGLSKELAIVAPNANGLVSTQAAQKSSVREIPVVGRERQRRREALYQAFARTWLLSNRTPQPSARLQFERRPNQVQYQRPNRRLHYRSRLGARSGARVAFVCCCRTN
jgi:hypothetical protein